MSQIQNLTKNRTKNLMVYSICFIKNRMKSHMKSRMKISSNRKFFVKNLTKNLIKNRTNNLFVYNEHKTIAAAMVGSRLDFCNSLLADTSISNLACLQLVQNTLARVIAQKSWFCRITPVLSDLHCILIYLC